MEKQKGGFRKWAGKSANKGGRFKEENFYGIYDDRDRTALGEVRKYRLKGAKKEKGGYSEPEVFLTVEKGVQPYCTCGEFVVAVHQSDDKFVLYPKDRRPVQIRSWNEFNESKDFKGTAVEYLREQQNSPSAVLTPLFKICTHDMIISDGKQLYSGFVYDFSSRLIRIGHVRQCRMKERSPSALRRICYVFSHNEVEYEDERFVLIQPFRGTTDEFLQQQGMWKALDESDENSGGAYSGDSSVTPGTFGEEPAETHAEAPQNEEPASAVEAKESATETEVNHGAGAGGSGFEVSQTSSQIPWACSDEEMQFLEKLQEYIENCGYTYEPRDVIRFHTSMKTGMITILSGSPGCGKSSLVELYARVLAGKKFEKGVKGLLQVDVNPSWAEPADLLGYWSPQDNDVFLSARNGLYEYLREAMKNEAEMYPVCFEEMNLACVEYYFSDFIQALARDKRTIYGYKHDGEAELEVCDNVRFVGTCNNDETSRRFSPRFLDRCNLIKLEDGTDWGFDTRQAGFELLSDQEPITAKIYASWSNEDSIAVAPDKLVNSYFCKLSEAFSSIGAGISPRTRKHITKYVRSRPNVENVETEQERVLKALDEAVVQRVVPRCVITPMSLEGSRYVVSLLSSFPDGLDGDKIVDNPRMELSVKALTDLIKEHEELLKWNG